MKKLIGILFLPFLVNAAVNKAADVEFKDAQGKVIGTGHLSQMKKGVKIALNLSGLSPGQHGIHFHENGKCEGPKFESAGGHLNPDHKEHGLNNPKGHHVGDMPNITADKDGNVKSSVVDESATMMAGDHSLIKDGGVSIIIHAKNDDQKSDPSGNSGDRVACAVVDLK